MLVIFGLVFISKSTYAVSENANQNKEQAQTQNQANETQIQTQNNEQTQSENTSIGEMNQEQNQNQEQLLNQENQSQYQPKNQNSSDHMNKNELLVQNMINFSNQLQNQAVGSQIRTVAENQIQSEDNTNQAIDKSENRNAALKFLIGPDYKQLKEVKKEIEQNQNRILILQKLTLELSNQSDQVELQNIIFTLEKQNTDLQDELNNLTSGFSIFGWLSRWISGY